MKQHAVWKRFWFLPLLAACSPLSGGGGGADSVLPVSQPTPPAVVDPTIVGVHPADGSSNAFKTDNILVGFDVPIDADSLTPPPLVVYKTSLGPGSALSGIVSYDSFTRSIVFDPTLSLEEVTNYTAELASTIESESGGTLQQPHAWSFTTRDQTPPNIVSTVPTNASTNADPYTPISIFFDEPLNPASLTVKTSTTGSGAITFFRTSTPTILIPGAIAYVPGSTEVQFTPAVQMLPVTNYTMRVQFVEDSSGNSQDSLYSFSFTVKDYLYASLSAPFDGATGVPIDSSITVSFNHPIVTSTVNTSTFVVSGGVATDLPISFSGGNTFATFIPNAALAPFTTYMVTLDASIADTLGFTLEVPVQFSFTTGGGVTSWNAALAVDTGISLADSTDYQSVQAPNGDTFSIWAKNAVVYASRMPAGGVWEAPVQISNPADGPLAFSPSIAVDGNGNAMAVWVGGTSTAGGSTLTNTRVFTLKYTPSTGWFPPTARTPVSSVSFATVGPTRIAMNQQGWALIIWRRFVHSGAAGSQYQVYGRVFFPNPSFTTGGFGSEQKTQGNQSLDADNLQVAIDGNVNGANGIAMWTQNSAVSNKHLFGNRCTNGTWTTSTAFVDLDNQSANIASDSLRMKMDTAGSAIATWSQGSPGARNIYARRYNGSSWTAITLLENQANDARFPDIALTETTPSNAIVVWQQADGGGAANHLYFNKYTAASNSWLPSGVQITAHNPFEVARPAVVMLDAIENAMVLWREKTLPSSVWQISASKYAALQGTWGASASLCSDTANSVNSTNDLAPQIVVRANRNPVALWSQNSGSTYTLWSNFFR